jgi:hypothetical protein
MARMAAGLRSEAGTVRSPRRLDRRGWSLAHFAFKLRQRRFFAPEVFAGVSQGDAG